MDPSHSMDGKDEKDDGRGENGVEGTQDQVSEKCAVRV